MRINARTATPVPSSPAAGGAKEHSSCPNTLYTRAHKSNGVVSKWLTRVTSVGRGTGSLNRTSQQVAVAIRNAGGRLGIETPKALFEQDGSRSEAAVPGESLFVATTLLAQSFPRPFPECRPFSPRVSGVVLTSTFVRD